MTKQEMRQFAHKKRKEAAKEKEENEIFERVRRRQKEVLNDPYRRYWNKYNCWNYRTIEGIEKDVAAGWIFEVRDGQIFSVNNPVVDKIKRDAGVEKISYEEYQKIIKQQDGLTTVEGEGDGK